MAYAAASLQGCGGCGRGGLLPGRRGNDKENGLPEGVGSPDGAQRDPGPTPLEHPGLREACHRAALRADPLAPSGLRFPPYPPSLASSAEMRAFRASFSSRARRAMSLTASNSSRLTRSMSRRNFSAWVRITVSNSRLTPCAAPAASFIRRPISSKNRLLVWVMSNLLPAFDEL